jgi:plastocyanin
VVFLLALAAPAQAATVNVRVGDGYDPASVRVAEGDTVLWTWVGPNLAVSVTSLPGQAESFDSDPGRPPGGVFHNVGDQFAYDFINPGTFRYGDKSNPAVRGVVTVVGDPDEGGPNDRTPPTLTRARLRPSPFCTIRSDRCPRPGARISYRLSERSDVVARVRPARGRRTLRFLKLRGRAGTNVNPVRLRGLKPGRYKLLLRATDKADNDGRPVEVRFRVRTGTPRPQDSD